MLTTLTLIFSRGNILYNNISRITSLNGDIGIPGIYIGIYI